MYWLHMAPDDTVRITLPQGTLDEVTGHSELWATSLTDRTAKCIRTGLPVDTKLHPGRCGVFWTELDAYPDTHSNLWYCHNDELRAVKVKGFSGDVSHAYPVELNGRLFWFSKQGAPLNDANLWQPTALVSANYDGSDQRETPIVPVGDLSMDQWNGNNDWGPHTYGNALYCLMYSSTNSEPPYDKRNSVCRIHPDRTNLFETVYQLPRGATFDTLDEGYVYFTLPETKYDGAWASITGDTRGSQSIAVLCRATLPTE
jgi:hypothetical protein